MQQSQPDRFPDRAVKALATLQQLIESVPLDNPQVSGHSDALREAPDMAEHLAITDACMIARSSPANIRMGFLCRSCAAC